MSEFGDGQAPPPDVPAEFVEAYRKAYDEALSAAPPVPRTRTAARRTHVRRPIPRPKLRRPATDIDPRRLRLLVVAVAAVLAVVLVVYLLIQAFSGGPTRVAKPWKGPVAQRRVLGVSATCAAPASPARRASYGAEKMIDSLADTAWRCNGDGHGARVLLNLGGPVRVGEVGLIPGYATTSRRNHPSGYNRITRVRWSIGSTQVVQRLRASDHGMQVVRIPPTTAKSLRLEILGSTPGPLHATAISEVRVAAARR